MSAGADIAWRLALRAAAAIAAFAIALYAVKVSRGLARRDAAAAAVAFWAIFLADMLPVAAAFSGFPASASLPFTVALYVVALAWAVYAASRGMGKGIMAAAVAVALGWFFNILFAWVYEAALQ